MQHLILIALGLAASTTSASLLKRQLSCSDPSSSDCQDQESTYLEQVCLPSNATGYPDFNAPCVQTQLITIECMYGAAGLNSFLGTDSISATDDSEDTPTLSNSTQRDCVCESQYFAALTGCDDCYRAHGALQGVDGADYINAGYIASISSSYCAVTNTPTVGLADMLYGIATGSLASSVDSVASTASASTFSDPIGNQTAVSYYYTPSVTGSAAWFVAQATSSAGANSTSDGSASGSGSASSSSESLVTSNGQIVATAGAATTTGTAASGTASGASGTAAGASDTASTPPGSMAGRQEAAAIAGVIALAGFVAML
ncbi:hypothetical protein LTR53_009338 [Teratosphaeriaceae sp. CCFEE 6253]|nr:hypothetical protein LTR53_009338 [Teratosphaeriaceae sp. CCFEE 6253]